MDCIKRIKEMGWTLWKFKGLQCCMMKNGVCFLVDEPTKYYKNPDELRKEIITWDI